MRIKNVFDWINEITLYKTSSEKFSDEEWSIFNSWLINKYISMHPPYCEVANIAQSILYEHKKDIYNFYKEIIPKNKITLNYIKSKNKPPNTNLTSILSRYFECSTREIIEILPSIPKPQLTYILTSMGKDPKETKTLLK